MDLTLGPYVLLWHAHMCPMLAPSLFFLSSELPLSYLLSRELTAQERHGLGGTSGGGRHKQVLARSRTARARPTIGAHSPVGLARLEVQDRSR